MPAQRRADQDKKLLLKQLIDTKLIEKSKALEAARQAESTNTPILIYLVTNNLIDAKAAANFAAKFFEIPLYDISAHDIAVIPRNFLKFEFVHKRYGLPIYRRADTLVIAVGEPRLIEFRNIGFMTSTNVQFILVEANKLQDLIEEVLGQQKTQTEDAPSEAQFSTQEFMSSLNQQTDNEFDEFEVSTVEVQDDEDVLSSDDINDTPVVRFVNKILIDAIRSKSSDIHFEPYEKACRVRYRQDGMLHEIVNAPKKINNSIVARLKVMADLDISEHRVPQDGRFRLTVAKGQHIDIRISTCPTVYGEKVVMRVLDPTSANLELDQLGMTDIQRDNFLKAISAPQGIILVTGPTGSGKTVTLYTALRILNRIETNISTVEDPVEIYMQGINQVQVNTKVGMTFAEALKSFLRQDPDIIMVGEIRDLETAEIAVKASQTGHLVLSTLHTNSAPLTITRLSSMGLESFNIASSVTLVMAQRLVRKLCPRCKKPVKDPKEQLLRSGIAEERIPDKLELFEPDGCSQCRQGYKGRIGIYEVMPISDAMTDLIMNKGNALELEKLARGENVDSLRASGFNLVLKGITDMLEVDRVTLF